VGGAQAWDPATTGGLASIGIFGFPFGPLVLFVRRSGRTVRRAAARAAPSLPGLPGERYWWLATIRNDGPLPVTLLGWPDPA
jgi:hypothetical protein